MLLMSSGFYLPGALDKIVLFGYILPGFDEMGCSVMVTLQILVLPLGVRIPSSQSYYGPFVYRLGREILSLQRGVRFP